jgi:hypothetical protein
MVLLVWDAARLVGDKWSLLIAVRVQFQSGQQPARFGQPAFRRSVACRLSPLDTVVEIQ